METLMTLKDFFYYISQEDEPYHLISYHTTQYHAIGSHLGPSVSKEVRGTSGKMLPSQNLNGASIRES